MPLEIVPSGQEKVAVSITIPTIVEMVQGFCEVTQKMIAPAAARKLDIKNDSHAVYYTKAEVEQLFKDNLNSDGLRIYLAVHRNGPNQSRELPHRPPAYLYQHTVILVATKNKVDQLATGNFVVTGNTGTEEGELCPPPACQGPIDAQLQQP
ncbi:MAG TPA: hypothetical protein VFE32_19200 [Puia sp.]|jgi:hypothetical protein|nr:hypothetical protein [Puia sp.]